MRITKVLPKLLLGATGVLGGFWAWQQQKRRKSGAPAQTVPLDAGRAARTAELAKAGAVAGATFVAHKAQLVTAGSDERKAELSAAYELKSAEQVAETLGNMKGVLMKLGQMASFVNEGFPEQLREQLAVLQADAPPMSAELAAGVIEQELGGSPDKIFAEWDAKPLAAASIGQVHRARLHDGTAVAVKVQYPGVEKAIRADLANTAMLTSMLGVVFKGLDVGPFVAELKERVGEELDYKLEAKRQMRFHAIYDGHPTISVPRVLTDLSTDKVLVTKLSTGVRFPDTVDWAQEDRELAAETIYRFVFRSFNRHQLFNGDPHPGNYLFERGGPMGVRVVFLDFGLVKEFTDAEMSVFWDMIRYQVTDRDPVRYRKIVEDAGLLVPGAPYSTEELMDYFGYFYHPVLEDKPFSYTREYAREALKRTFDPNGPHTEMMKWFNLPPAFVVLNRIQWGLNAVLASFDATQNWRAISDELWPWTDREPTTELGKLEHDWLAIRNR
jgi:predicted unusual protein kinase regulating ubiquinone biosynthesis (AarF/ABC1/UbiB family)